MISIYKISVYNENNSKEFIYDIRCKSTDTKPTDDIPNGSSLIEIDTGDVYFYDAESKTWNAM